MNEHKKNEKQNMKGRKEIKEEKKKNANKHLKGSNTIWTNWKPIYLNQWVHIQNKKGIRTD